MFYIRKLLARFFFERDDVTDQKKINNFLFKVILLNEDVLKRCFEIIKSKVGVKTESVFEKVILCTLISK